MILSRLAELTASLPQPVAEETLVEGRSDMTELIEKFCDKNKLYHFEGPRGEQSFEKLVAVLGYRSLSDFLEDNSGAYQAMIEWLGTQRNSEWIEALEAEVGPSDDDESDEDDEDSDRVHESMNDDDKAAKKIFDKIKGTPNLNRAAVEAQVKRYIGMVGKSEKDVKFLTASVMTLLQDAGMM